MPSVAEKLEQLQKKQTQKQAGGARTLECLRCKRRYSREDLLEGRYWIETKVCSVCYAEMQHMPYARCCFGKPSLVVPRDSSDTQGRIIERGYDERAKECTQLCPDRLICRLVVLGPGV